MHVDFELFRVKFRILLSLTDPNCIWIGGEFSIHGLGVARDVTPAVRPTLGMERILQKRTVVELVQTELHVHELNANELNEDGLDEHELNANGLHGNDPDEHGLNAHELDAHELDAMAMERLLEVERPLALEQLGLLVLHEQAVNAQQRH